MITNFEKITAELSEYELNTIVPAMILGLKTKIGKKNTITNKQMQLGLKNVSHIKTNPPRIRKMIQYIRITGAIERLIATSKGYYISNNTEELKKYIESLEQRAESISQLSSQLNYQKNKYVQSINK